MRLAAALTMVLLGVAVPAQAATITVDRTADASAFAGECESPAGPDCSVRQAIDKAAADDTVVIPADAAHYQVALGELLVNKPITLAGAGARGAVLDALGGSRRVLHVTGGVTVTVSGLTLTGGHTAAGGGGGAGSLVDVGATLRLVSSAVSGNVAETGDGGGIFVNGGGLELVTSAVLDNEGKSGNGGGLGLTDATGTVLIASSTVAGNKIQNIGGALEVANATVAIVNSTLTGNTSGSSAGGLYLSTAANVTLTNSIVAGNNSINQPTQDNCVPVGSFQPTTGGHNIEDQATCGFTATGDRQSTDPVLTPVQDNGGPTDTRAPLPGSPAIDAGDNAACTATDQRGALRPAGAACEVGAFEIAVPGATTGQAGDLSTTGAVLNGVAFNPDLAAGEAVFDYGLTPTYGQSTVAQAVPATSAQAPVAAPVAGLLPGTEYHFRLRTSNSAGAAAGADATFTTPPVVSVLARLHVKPKAFKAGRKARVTYDATQPATVTFTVQRPARGRRQAGKCRKPSARNRKGKRCKRWVKVTSFKHAAVIGPNSQPLVGARKLKPRRYRLRARPRNTAGAGRTVGARFRVKRAR